MVWKIAVFADVILLIFLALSVSKWLVSWQRVAHGGRAEGTVTGHRSALWSSGPNTWTPVKLIIAIVSYRDPAGGEHTTEVVGDLPLGETVSVLFNPDRPHRAFAEPRGGHVAYLVISLGLVAAVAACSAIAATAS
jgi:hypothetical protein